MITIDKTRCVGCGSCVGACPMGVLRMNGDTPEENPKRRCIQCMHCAAICPKKAVQCEGLTEDETYRTPPADALERLVVSRRSVRKFSDKLPPRALLQWAMDTAQYCPSGKNVHANRWTVLYGKAVTDRISDMVLDICLETGEAPELPKLAAHGTNLITCGAPCVLIGWSPIECLNPCKDVIVAATTVELLLKTHGVDACWGGYLNQLADASPELRAALGIPETARMQCALMLGYAQGEHYGNIPFRPSAAAHWVEA